MLKEKEWLVKLKRAIGTTHQRDWKLKVMQRKNVLVMIADRIIELAEQEQENEGSMGKLLKDHEEIIS